VSGVVGGRPERSLFPTRILIAGSDLLAGALASALTTYGFVTMHVVADKEGIERGIEWEPNLVLVDVRWLDLASGTILLGELHRAGLRMCVIDASDEVDRLDAWKDAGASVLIDRREPFDRLFSTINRTLRIGAAPRSNRRSSASSSVTYASEQGEDPVLRHFANLTEREQSVLAELMEGHCAEEIANAAFVSISTVRSQIKAILQKLGVNSQLAAVALARRAGWSLTDTRRMSPPTSNGGRARVG
jgi:two-component system, NarL family, nitrate/nitrite response regulator NarL